MMTKVNKSGKGTSIRTLDSVIGDKIKGNLAFIKIDCEGMSLDILKGAKKTIQRYQPDISVEVDNELERIDSYLLPFDSHVELSIHNLLGEHISTLVNESQEIGKHIAQFQAEHLASGIYFCKINVDGFEQNRAMILKK